MGQNMVEGKTALIPTYGEGRGPWHRAGKAGQGRTAVEAKAEAGAVTAQGRVWQG